jgi:hypothetical protein
MLAAWATCIMAVSSSGIRNSLIFGSSCFLSPSFFFRAPSGVLARISRRARCALRSRWACHWGCCWGSGTACHK